MPHYRKIGGFEFLPELNLLRNGEIEVHLEPKHADVLSVLAQTPGDVRSKSDLLDAVWADVYVTEEVLTNAIYALRRALGDSARAPRYIQTIPKRGYRLIATVSDLPAPAIPAFSRRRWVAAVAVALAAMGLAGHREAEAPVRLDDPTARIALGETIDDAKSDWSSIAMQRWQLVSSRQLSKELGLPLVERAARRAIESDSADPRAHRILGLVHSSRWEWSEAEGALMESIRLDPHSALSHSALAELLLLTGRIDEAQVSVSRAVELEPDSIPVLLSAGFVHTMARNRAAARQAYDSVLSLDPQNLEAARNLRKLREGSHFGHPLSAERIDRLLQKGELRPAIVAGMFAEAGEDERALEWLQKARREKDTSLLLVRLDDRWTRLHEDQRFRVILDDVGL